MTTCIYGQLWYRRDVSVPNVSGTFPTPLYVKLSRIIAIACGFNPDPLYHVQKYIYGFARRRQGCLRSLPLYKNSFREEYSNIYAWIHVDDTIISSTCPQKNSPFSPVYAWIKIAGYFSQIMMFVNISASIWQGKPMDLGRKTRPKVMDTTPYLYLHIGTSHVSHP